jgi:F0F1-type ATP synthase membrane subunit b/b'
LGALVWTFKKVFIPRINEVYFKRDEYINKYARDTEKLNKEIDEIKNKIETIKNEEVDKTTKTIKEVIKKTNYLLDNSLKTIKEENEMILNGMRTKFNEDIKNINKLAKFDIEKTAECVIDRIFNEHF